MSQQELQCEMTRSAGFDPTGEWAVECGADGEYCPECDMVVCAYCHQSISHGPNPQKKAPGSVTITAKRQAG